MSFALTHFISAFLLPPLCLLLPGLAGLVLWHKRPAIARGLVAASLGLLWLLSTPIVSAKLMQMLEGTPAVLDPKAQPAEAIVVLSGGTYFAAPEYGMDTPNEFSLVRLRYAAKLQRETGKPVLVAGGKPQGSNLAEAEQMKSVLENEFRIPVKWTESKSNNTLENARFSRQILGAEGIKRIYLVTHAWHMARAVMAFRDAGFEVTPAPTAYSIPAPFSLVDLLPHPYALQDSYFFMHELIGMMWYRLKSAS